VQLTQLAGQPDFKATLARPGTPAHEAVNQSLIALGAGFNPILTGRENILVNGSILGLNKNEISEKIEGIIDFAEIKNRIQPIINKLDHSYLNDIIIHPTTSENIAGWLFKQANDQFGCVTKVTLYETDSCGAIVEK
jgi:hypothetical protein